MIEYVLNGFDDSGDTLEDRKKLLICKRNIFIQLPTEEDMRLTLVLSVFFAVPFCPYAS